MAMNTRKLTLLFTALIGLAVSAFAQSTATEATVARVTGTVTATLPDGSTVTVTEGSKLPQGATITTGDKSEAYLVSHGDSTSKISENSVVEIAELSTTSAGGKVTEQKATLDLKSGNLVAKLNPAKKSVNQYSVRTPKGVAAARGTTYTVSYKGGTFAIAVVGGQVSIIQTGGAPMFVNAGSAAYTSDGSTLQAIDSAGLSASGPLGAFATEVRELMAVAVATVAVAAERGIGGTTAAEFKEVVDAVIKSDPANASQVAALVAASTTSSAITSTVVESVRATSGDAAATAVQNTVTDTKANMPTQTTTPGTSTPRTETPAETPTTTPQPIDPSTVSRSGEE